MLKLLWYWTSQISGTRKISVPHFSLLVDKETMDIDQLRLENERLRAEVAALKEQLQQGQSILDPRKIEESVYKCPPFPALEPLHDRNLTNEEIARYGRQLILNEIGIEGKKITDFRIL